MGRNGRKVDKRKVQQTGVPVDSLQSLCGKELTPIVVQWRDHQVLSHMWFPVTAIDEVCNDEALITSVGWPVHITRDVVCIAQTVGDGQVGEVLQILRREVKRIYKLVPGKQIE